MPFLESEEEAARDDTRKKEKSDFKFSKRKVHCRNDDGVLYDQYGFDIDEFNKDGYDIYGFNKE